MFPKCLILLRGDNSWPTRSPEFIPCDFFLGSYIKFYYTDIGPRSLQALKEAIRRLPLDMFERSYAKLFSLLGVLFRKLDRYFI